MNRFSLCIAIYYPLKIILTFYQKWLLRVGFAQFLLFPRRPKADKGEKGYDHACAHVYPYEQMPRRPKGIEVRIFSDAFSRMTIAYVVRLVEASKLNKSNDGSFRVLSPRYTCKLAPGNAKTHLF